MTISVTLLTRSISGINAISYMRAAGPLSYLAESPDFAIEAAGVREVLAASQEGRDGQLLNRDICVLSRMFSGANQHQIVDLVHLYGGIVVFDTDDDLTGRIRHVFAGDAFTRMLGLADYVTVSTKPLAKQLASLTRRAPIVLPDTIDFPWYAEASLKANRVFDPRWVTVGLVGTDTHDNDWWPAAEALHKLVDKYPNILPVMACDYAPPYIENLPRLATIRPVPYYGYPALMRQMDIVCCCLDPDDEFNHLKAGVKALESMAAARELGNGASGGAVPVCTNITPYRDVVARHTGVLIDNDQWYEALEDLVANQEARYSLAAKGLAHVERHHNMAREYTRWGRAYKECLCGGISLEVPR